MPGTPRLRKAKESLRVNRLFFSLFNQHQLASSILSHFHALDEPCELDAIHTPHEWPALLSHVLLRATSSPCTS